MKKNKVALITTLVLAAIALIVLITHTTNTLQSGENNFAIDDSSTVTKIFLSDKNNHAVTLKKLEPGNWTVNEKYQARPDLINLLLYTLTHIEIKSPVSKNAQENTIKRLSSIGVKIEVYQNVYRINLFDKLKLFQHEKCTKTYYIGDATMDNMGTHMLMEGSNEPYITFLPGLNGYISRQYTPVEAEWRSHKILSLSINDISSIQYDEAGHPEQSYVIRRDGKKFGIMATMGKKMVVVFDTMKVVDLFTSFKNLNFESELNELNKSFKDSIISQGAFNILTVTDSKGTSYTIKAYKKPNYSAITDVDGKVYPYDRDRFYALINRDKDFVLCQYFVFDRMLKPLSFFVSEQQK